MGFRHTYEGFPHYPYEGEEDEDDMKPTYDRIPEHMQDGARLYIEQGIPPGSFLSAVLRNDFHTAIVQADRINSVRLRDWADWLYWDIPRMAWGSLEIFNTWVEKGGMKGMAEAVAEEEGNER